MVRPNSENPTTSERMRKVRQNDEKRIAANVRRAIARENKKKTVTLTAEELEEKRRKARERKRNSRNMSRQKTAGAKITDKNRKRKIRQEEVSTPDHPTSAERTRLYRANSKVNVGSLCKGKRRKSQKVQ